MEIRNPTPSALSIPIAINITNDNIVEGLESFQAHIVETSHWSRVRIGPQNIADVIIVDEDACN